MLDEQTITRELAKKNSGWFISAYQGKALHEYVTACRLDISESFVYVERRVGNKWHFTQKISYDNQANLQGILATLFVTQANNRGIALTSFKGAYDPKSERFATYNRPVKDSAGGGRVRNKRYKGTKLVSFCDGCGHLRDIK